MKSEIELKRESCRHEYEEVDRFDMEAEVYQCKKCGHRYKLYYDEIR